MAVVSGSSASLLDTKIVEGLRSLPEVRSRSCAKFFPLVRERRRGGGGDGLRTVPSNADGCVGIVKNQIGKQAVGFAGQFFAQPSLR